MRWVVALAVVSFPATLFGAGYYMYPDHEVYEIPSIESVPIPRTKPPTPAQIDQIRLHLEEVERLEFEKRQRRTSGKDQCPRYATVRQRVPGSFVVVERHVARGSMPCHLLEPGSLSWWMNGKNI